jgi:RHS repeat-associated protein
MMQSGATEHVFTGKERDTESGNDYFGARYYASSIGRMLSPDPSGLVFADQTNPQSFNLYAYVRNNPLSFTDPSGLYCAWEDGTSDDDAKDGGATKKQCNKQGGHWTDSNNPCHGMDNCVATFDWNDPNRDKTPTYTPDPWIEGVPGAIPLPITVVQPLPDPSLALATAVMSRGIPKACAIGFTGKIGNARVGASVSGNGVGGNINGHSAGTETPQAPGVDMRSASPLFKSLPVGVYLSPGDFSGNSVSSVSVGVDYKGKVGPIPVNVKGDVYLNTGTYTPNINDSQNCPN